MPGKANTAVVAAALVVALGAVAAGYHASQELREVRAHLVDQGPARIIVLLRENAALLQELSSSAFAEKDTGILEAYLAKIRRDGVPKHADMKQRLDTLAENNTAIVTLIGAYAPYAKTSAFTSEGDKYRNYASAWRDRWNSVMELFMAGGNYVVSGVPFPAGFQAAVDAEIAAVTK